MKRDNVNRILCAVFSCVFALVFGAVGLYALLSNERLPEEYTLAVKPTRMLLCCAIWAVLLGGAALLCRRFSTVLERRAWWFAGGMLALFAAVCAVMGWLLMVQNRYDVAALCEGAQFLLQNGTLGTQTDYFYIRPNNVFPALAVACLFRIGEMVGATDPAIAFLIANVVALSISVLSVFGITKMLRGGAAGVFALFVCLYCLPLYVYAPVYYTDTLAMPFVIGGVWLYLAALQRTGWRQTILLCACGLALGLGMALKLTVVIAFIAMAVHAVLRFARRSEWKLLLRIGICTVSLLTICNLAAGGVQRTLLPDAERRENEKLPFIHWTMMGLTGDGRWNNADELFSTRESTQQARVQAGLAETGRRLQTMGIDGFAQLLARKSLYSFGDGTYNAGSMLDDDPLRPNILHSFVLYTAPHFMLWFYLCTALHIVLLLCAAIGAFCDVLCRRTVPDASFVLRLSWFGLWMFLMLWESNARYLVHFLPILLLCAAWTGVDMIFRRGKISSENQNHKEAR